MLTQKGYYDILDRVFKTGGMTEDMEKDISALKSELDEREGVLREYGEAYDGEDASYEWKPKENAYKAKFEELTGKYNNLVERYNRKFFAGGSAHADDTTLYEGDTTAADTAENEITIDELFKEG